jgi:hypothetical protein
MKLGIQAGVENFEGAMRRRIGFHLGKTRDKTGFVAERRNDGVVRMACLPVGQNHDAGLRLPQHRGDFQPVLPGVFQSSIGKIESMPPGSAQKSRSLLSFGCTFGGGAASSRFALGQIENGGTQPNGRRLQQGSPACLLHIITMRGNCEDVDGLDHDVSISR